MIITKIIFDENEKENVFIQNVYIDEGETFAKIKFFKRLV